MKAGVAPNVALYVITKRHPLEGYAVVVVCLFFCFCFLGGVLSLLFFLPHLFILILIVRLLYNRSFVHLSFKRVSCAEEVQYFFYRSIKKAFLLKFSPVFICESHDRFTYFQRVRPSDFSMSSFFQLHFPQSSPNVSSEQCVGLFKSILISCVVVVVVVVVDSDVAECCCTLHVALSVFFRMCMSFNLLHMFHVLLFRTSLRCEGARESERRYQRASRRYH